MDVRELLEQVKSGGVNIEEAEKQLKNLPYEDWDMPSWTITGSCDPVLGKLYSARESRMRICWKYIRNFMRGTGRFWEPGLLRSRLSW